MARPISPTPYPDVNAVLDEFLTGARTILGDQFVGMYLSGSLALGDFSPRSSDIDVVVVTAAPLSEARLAALRAMHARFNAGDSPWATEVEAVYMPREPLRRHDPAQIYHPHIERGPACILDRAELGREWDIQRYILREHGVAVGGPPPDTLIDPVPPDALRRAIAFLVRVWWGPMIADPVKLRHPGYHAYAVLTMCRMLYSLDTGDVVSKLVAARWALARQDGRWATLIQAALAWRKDCPQPLDRDLHETRDLIGYTLDRCRPWL